MFTHLIAEMNNATNFTNTLNLDKKERIPSWL
jgi:hypothetical protein